MIWERDVLAVAKAIDGVAFRPRRLHGSSEGVSEDYWEHILARRKSARRTAKIVMRTLLERGWSNHQ